MMMVRLSKLYTPLIATTCNDVVPRVDRWFQGLSITKSHKTRLWRRFILVTTNSYKASQKSKGTSKFRIHHNSEHDSGRYYKADSGEILYKNVNPSPSSFRVPRGCAAMSTWKEQTTYTWKACYITVGFLQLKWWPSLDTYPKPAGAVAASIGA
jgi:hypothetical protein